MSIQRAIDTVTDAINRIGDDLAPLGGALRCRTCGTERPVGDGAAISQYLRGGWPRCCDHTMQWLTKQEIETEQDRGDA